MRGVEYAKTVTAAALRTRLPGKVDELHVRLGVEAANPRQNIAAPAGAAVPPAGGWVLTDEHVVTGEPHKTFADRWPQVFVAGRDTVRTVEEAPGRFTVTYSLRVWVLADGQEHAETDARRDRLMLAVREALLDRQLIALDELQPGIEAEDIDGAAAVRPGIVESFADVALEDDARTVAAGYLDVQLDVHEELADAGAPFAGAEPAIGTVMPPGGTALPPHPALQ